MVCPSVSLGTCLFLWLFRDLSWDNALHKAAAVLEADAPEELRREACYQIAACIFTGAFQAVMFLILA